MNPIQGVSQNTIGSGVCASAFALASGQSCLLNLHLDGSLINSFGIQGGPMVCVQGSALECYQPNAADSLDITIDDTIFSSGFDPIP